MDYTNGNVYAATPVLAYTGYSVGALWLAIGAVALGGLLLCVSHLVPKSEDN